MNLKNTMQICVPKKKKEHYANKREATCTLKEFHNLIFYLCVFGQCKPSGPREKKPQAATNSRSKASI